MTNKQIQQKFYFVGTITTGLVAVSTALNILANQSIYIIIIFSCVAIALTIQYFRVLQDGEESNRYDEDSAKNDTNQARFVQYKFPEIRNSKALSYLRFIIPVSGILICILVYSFSSVSGKDEKKSNFLAKSESLPSCMSEELPNRSICIAKFTEDEIDRFSQSLQTGLSGKTDSKELRIVDHDSFVYSGRNLKRQLDSIKYMHCIDTGMIVHGVRSSTDSIFYCQVNFLNYERRDTLIDNPDEIRFSFHGHLKYLSNFLLAQNESSNKEYRYALNLFLDAKDLGEGDEFNSIVDYYIGNMYFNLHKMDSAQLFYERSIKVSSSVQEFAIIKLQQAKSGNVEGLKQTSTKGSSPFDETDEDRVRMISMFNSEFKYHASKHFQVEKRHGKKIQYNDFVRLSRDTWDLASRQKYVSKWILFRDDSLHYFEMTTKLYNEETEESAFGSRLRKKWAVQARRDLKCVISRPDLKWHSGWDISFVPAQNTYAKSRSHQIHFDWFYYLILSGREPYRKLENYSLGTEVGRVRQVEDGLTKLMIWARLNKPINELNYVDLLVEGKE